MKWANAMFTVCICCEQDDSESLGHILMKLSVLIEYKAIFHGSVA